MTLICKLVRKGPESLLSRCLEVAADSIFVKGGPSGGFHRDCILAKFTFYQILATNVNYQRCRGSGGTDCADNPLWYTNTILGTPRPSVDRKM
jgi:hypothetical protein